MKTPTSFCSLVTIELCGIVLLLLLTIGARVSGDLKLQPNGETEDCTESGNT